MWTGRKMTVSICAAPSASALRFRYRVAALWTSAVASAVLLAFAFPALAGEGPPLSAYFTMTPEERIRAVGADGRPAAFVDAHTQVAKGEWVGFDECIPLPYLAWPADLSHGAIWVGDMDRAHLEKLIEDPSLRMLMVDDLSMAAFVAQSHFTPLFHSESAPCTVFIRR